MHKTGYLYGKIRLCYNKEVTTGNRGNGRSMTIFDTLAERHIQAALESGELQGLAGEGKPLTLDDDSHVPPELRVGYRLLKNAGYLPRHYWPGRRRFHWRIYCPLCRRTAQNMSRQTSGYGCWHYRCSRRGSIRIFCITVTMTPYNRH